MKMLKNPWDSGRGTVLGLGCLLAIGLLLGAPAAQGQGGAIPTKAIAVLHATGGNEVTGTVTFTQTDDGVLIEAHVFGLSPGKHGFHIHEFGDASSSDGKSAGGHFNPEGNDHAGPDSAKRHVGDLGNLVADANGHAMYKKVDKTVQIHGAHTILSRGVVVHAGEDDMTSQPTGAAGGRLAVGVIGIANTK